MKEDQKVLGRGDTIDAANDCVMFISGVAFVLLLIELGIGD